MFSQRIHRDSQRKLLAASGPTFGGHFHVAEALGGLFKLLQPPASRCPSKLVSGQCGLSTMPNTIPKIIINRWIYDWWNSSFWTNIYSSSWNYTGWWFQPTPLKNDGVKVSWDDDIPNWMDSHKIPWFQSPPTSRWLSRWNHHVQDIFPYCSMSCPMFTDDTLGNYPIINPIINY